MAAKRIEDFLLDDWRDCELLLSLEHAEEDEVVVVVDEVEVAFLLRFMMDFGVASRLEGVDKDE